MKRAALLLAAALLTGCATVPDRPPTALAITIDDLPVHGGSPEEARVVSQQVLRALKDGGALTATGFVNGQWTERDPGLLEVLRGWREAGQLLANHGWAHRNLGSVSLPDATEEIVRNEALLEKLGPGTDWRWFRYPFLAEGSGEQRLAIRRLLAERGYRIAAVTMDFSDWQWTAPYARCRTASDEKAIARLEQLYMDAARESIAYSRALGKNVHGRDIPHVLLIHAGAFTARMLPRLLALYREEGFRFTTLAEAQRDPAFAAEQAPAGDAPRATLEGQAAARGLLPPPRTSYGALLERICA